MAFCIATAVARAAQVTKTEIKFKRPLQICTSAALIVSLGACAVKYPDSSSIDNSGSFLNIQDSHKFSREYIRSARDEITTAQNYMKAIEWASDLAIVGGAAAAIAGGLYHWSSRSVITAGLFAAGGLTVNAGIAPRAQRAVLDKGLTALGCVDAKTEAAYAVTRLLNAQVSRVDAALRTFSQVLVEAQHAAGDRTDRVALLAEYEVKKDAAHELLDATEASFASMGQEARLATDEVLREVNSQLSMMVADGPTWQSLATANFKKTAAVSPSATGGSGGATAPAPGAPPDIRKRGLEADQWPEILARLKVEGRRLDMLTDALKQRISASPLSTGKVDYSSCSLGHSEITIIPEGNIDVSPEAQFIFTVGGGPSCAKWSGSPPTGVTITPECGLGDSQAYTISKAPQNSMEAKIIVNNRLGQIKIVNYKVKVEEKK